MSGRGACIEIIAVNAIVSMDYSMLNIKEISVTTPHSDTDASFVETA